MYWYSIILILASILIIFANTFENAQVEDNRFLIAGMLAFLALLLEHYQVLSKPVQVSEVVSSF